MSDPTVTVVIPTIGRPSLPAAIASVHRQGIPVEVIVVNDSGHPLDPGLVAGASVVLETPGLAGPSAARNVGFEAARGDYVALLDDDDVWLAGHLGEAVEVLHRLRTAEIYCSRGLVIDDRGVGRTEPVDNLGGRTIIDYTFGSRAVLHRGRRILTPTLVFGRDLARAIPMDPALRQSEDTWWLLTAEAGHGARVHQSERIGVLIVASAQRRSARETDETHIAWAERVEALRAGTGAAHLTLAARTAAWEGNYGQVLRLGRRASRMPGGRRLLPVFAAEAVLGLGLALTHRGRRGETNGETNGETGGDA